MRVMILEWSDQNHDHSLNISDTETVMIGRSPNCQIVLNDSRISRQHAFIYSKKDSFYVRCLSNTNPIHINDIQRLRQRDAIQLKADDTLRLGPVPLKVTAIESIADIEIKIRCATCDRIVDAAKKDCPYCGASLAYGDTILPI